MGIVFFVHVSRDNDKAMEIFKFGLEGGQYLIFSWLLLMFVLSFPLENI